MLIEADLQVRCDNFSFWYFELICSLKRLIITVYDSITWNRFVLLSRGLEAPSFFLVCLFESWKSKHSALLYTTGEHQTLVCAFVFFILELSSSRRMANKPIYVYIIKFLRFLTKFLKIKFLIYHWKEKPSFWQEPRSQFFFLRSKYFQNIAF